MKQLGIPYMGSKRKLAKQLIDYMIAANPRAKYFYDLFGGGGAMSFEALKRDRFERVVYNEINTGVTELLKKIRDDGVTDELYKWVSREEFHAHKSDDTWYGGLVKTCWSFGNDQKSYLFSEENERLKKMLHDIVVFKSEAAIDEFAKETGLRVDKRFLRHEKIRDRRIDVMRFVNKSLGRVDLQQLQQLLQLDRLQQLEQLDRLPRLEVENRSYKDVSTDTPPYDTIVYMGPPYKGTKEYEHSIDHDELLEYIKKGPYKIYVSSYEFDGLECVHSMNHWTSMSATTKGKVTEKLFCNQKENIKMGLF